MISQEIKEQIAHQERIIENYSKTAKILELKVAHFGYGHTPSYIIQAQNHVALLENSQVPLVQRLENARLLEHADKRVGVCTLPEDIDDKYWCEPFPKGKYKIIEGSTFVELQEFRVARYPVTVWQFQQFVNERGYTNKRWWTKEGKPPNISPEFLLWNVPAWNAGNHPITSVSWYEANAFCLWLTARAHSAGWMPNEYEIRLPTEAEWIIAAKWDVKLKQMCSWSPPANEYWQNVQEVSIINNIVSPVGLFPQGVSPCGALDMAGNVWEWCSSSRNAFPMQAHVAKQNVKPSTRDLVLRGGSWKEKNKYAGWDVRSVASLPTTTLNDRGFRVFMCSRSKT
jgi:hypothetical protein